MLKPTPEKDTMIMHYASVSRTVGLVGSGKLILTVITPFSHTAHGPASILREDFQREASLAPSLSLPSSYSHPLHLYALPV